LKKLKASPSRFRREGLEVEQREATSKDGTKIPYFLVHKKSMKLNGKNPTLLYGYGGFEISMTPFYSGTVGKAWLEKGGVYAVANIRGGGEFGPRWHEAALKENRQRAFDDFIAVAEDLIEKNVTSPQHLGIQGGSNGGLLVGATFVQRPDLFHAVLCEVPLLDMLRYHHLLAGASWMAEYGDPDDPAMEEAISRYSPFQNVRANARYPEVFFFTSTKDDRVHPGHARRMVAKMEAEGHKVYYYENTEGGHGGAANLEQIVLRSALEFTYLWKKLK
jgi:prolyl oligopeptidase